MWIINPEGLPDAGKVVTVISSAFLGLSQKQAKRERQTAVRQYCSVKKEATVNGQH